MGHRLQLTLAIIKPDVTPLRLHVKQIRRLILSNGFYVVRSKKLALSQERAEEFYAEHRDKFFYNRLVSFMSSGVCHFHILMREDAIKAWRTLMGPTKVFKTRYEAPDTIRGRFGLTDTRNCSHGSDSEETARKEIEFYFPEFDQKSFERTEKPLFVQNKFFLDRVQFVHRLTS